MVKILSSQMASMRFLPIKGMSIKSEKTKEIVRKHLAFHVWLKANEITLNTNIRNIHNTIDAFEGKTFAEVILGVSCNSGKRVFAHVNHAWSNDPSQQKWSLSVQFHMLSDARKVLNNIQEMLYDQYGDDINKHRMMMRTGLTMRMILMRW